MCDIEKQYRVSASAPFEYRDFDCVRLEISMHQEYSEGRKFVACLDWANKNFSEVVLLIGDTLNRHNILSNNAYEDARKDGDAWLSRNKKSIPSNCRVIRWETILKNPFFFTYLNKINSLYLNNRKFFNTVNLTIFEAIERKKARNETFCEETFKTNSLNYLLEETAGLAIAYEEFPGVSAYHGDYNEMWSMFIDENIPDAPIGLKNSHCVRLQTRRRKIKNEKLAA